VKRPQIESSPRQVDPSGSGCLDCLGRVQPSESKPAKL
jgi:hypothetical protein